MLSKKWIDIFKRVSKVFLDAILISLSLVIAYKLRLEHNLSNETVNWFWSIQLPSIIWYVVGLRMLFLFLSQVYTRLWRYTEITELIELAKPIFLSSLLLTIPRLLGFSARQYLFSIPISVIIIDTALCLILLSCIRLLRKWQIQTRTIRKRSKNTQNYIKKRTILIGAGVAAQELARKVLQHPEINIEIIGALDDDIRKHKTKIVKNIKVFGPINTIERIVKEHEIHQIIIAIPSLPPQKLRNIIETCQKTNLEINIIPGVDQLAEGKVSVEQIRKVSLEDLLGREPVDLSIPEVANFVNNKTILITGAGGSIGSELTKQLVKNFKAEKIYILGRGENSIFQLSQELINYGSGIKFTPIICDIRNYKDLYKHLVKTAPDVVFHAAAHKHVPLMEDHPKEAYTNNLIGTKNLSEICGILKVKTLVNISTDKAVNPVNVMGCTKRLAEIIVTQCAKRYPSTKYVSVRFGNVIGSRGSVIPIWEYQLKNSMPLTVTHKEAYRFFMTLTEAASLVIKAGAVGKSSEIMVLDMGNEVSIYKLATDFIKLSGFNLDDVKITFLGLRTGEKLKEELVGYYEGANSTKYKKILVIEPRLNSLNHLDSVLKELESLYEVSTDEIFKSKLVDFTKYLNEVESSKREEVLLK